MSTASAVQLACSAHGQHHKPLPPTVSLQIAAGSAITASAATPNWPVHWLIGSDLTLIELWWPQGHCSDLGLPFATQQQTGQRPVGLVLGCLAAALQPGCLLWLFAETAGNHTLQQSRMAAAGHISKRPRLRGEQKFWGTRHKSITRHAENHSCIEAKSC